MSRIFCSDTVIRIFAEDKAKEFYPTSSASNWNGRQVWEGYPLYAQVKRSGLTLHLSEHHGDATPGSTTFVPIEDIDSLHRELQAKAYVAYARPRVETVGWGRVMEVTDPFWESHLLL